MMEHKFIIACCLFSFITGMYLSHIIEKDKGCTVSFGKEKEVHVLIGRV